MESTESGLELLLKRLHDIIESKIESLSYKEISTMSSKIPNFRSMLEFRQIRDKFLGKFNNPCPTPEVHSYAEQLLAKSSKDYDLSDDTKSSLKIFFENEIKRVERIRDIVLVRCKHPDFFSKTQMEYSLFDKSVTERLYFCREGLLRLDCKDSLSISSGDLMLEISTNFFQKRRRALLKTILLKARRFPLTKQQSIYTKMFEKALSCLKTDSNTIPVPILPRCEEILNNELKRLAKRFNMICDLEANDGQQFLYYSKKKFLEIFQQLNILDLPKKDYDLKTFLSPLDLTSLTQHTLLEITHCDTKLSEIFIHLFDLSSDDVLAEIQHKVAEYNSWVGNEYRSSYFHADIERNPIPSHKLFSWYVLRYAHMKFLASAILSHLNYFIYIWAQLSNNDSNVMRSTTFQARFSKFPQILEVCENDQPFLFSSVLDYYNKTIKALVSAGSYYITKFEEAQAERSGDSSVLSDRESVAEKLLLLELEFLNAKRKVIQPLIECLEHKENPHLVEVIFGIILERPSFNLPLYQSFDVPFKLSIELMEKRAKSIRALVNFQILHERNLSSQFNDQIPYFDRPSQISFDLNYRSFDESIPITPFEVYESLTDIVNFVDDIPKIANELGESIDIRLTKYKDYLEIAVWDEVNELLRSLVENGLFPFNRSSTHFHFHLSNCINSLFVSPYVNTLNSINDMISNMNQSRHLRFMFSMRRFLYLTWKLQSLIIDTDMLQNAYYAQCDQLGITEKGIIMTSFKESATKEIIDLHSEKADVNLLDVALTEFEENNLDFEQESSIKDIIFAADFSVLKRMIQFQVFQNIILELALRFNQHILDSNFLVSYFEMGPDSAMFLTGVNIPDEDDLHQRYMKQIIANKLFYQADSIFRINQLANQSKDQLWLSIRSLKGRSRTILSAHVKQKEMSHHEMCTLYLNEMIDQFSVYGYRVEIARLCNLERHILLANTFVDTYTLGPAETHCLVDSQGHFEKFFYVPTWHETFLMLQKAPHARQGMVLKCVLQFITSRFRILNLVRFECSLNQRINSVFDSIYNQCYMFETPILQKLFNDFAVLPNASEVEISTKFIREADKFLFHRFEYSLLSAVENFFISVNSAYINNTAIIDNTYGLKLQNLWLQMHQPLDSNKYVINRSRYAPLWQEQFVYNCLESDRSDIATRIHSTDVFLDSALGSMNGKEILDDPVQKIPRSIDFMFLTISQIQIKFAYFLLRDGVDEESIDLKKSIMEMNQDIYKRNIDGWDQVIVHQANENLVPKDESPSKVTDTIPEPKLAQAIFDVLRNQVDLILLSSQINQIQGYINEFRTDLDQLTEIVSSTAKLNFNNEIVGGSILSFQSPSKTDSVVYIQDNDSYDDQFIQERNYAHKRLVETLFTMLKQCVIQKIAHDPQNYNKNDKDVKNNNNDNDDDNNSDYNKDGDEDRNEKNDKKEIEYIIDAKAFDENASKLSFLLNQFSEESLNKENNTWRRYLMNVSVSIGYDFEEMEAANVLARLTNLRFERLIELEIGFKYSSLFLTVNQLRQAIHHRHQKEIQYESLITSKLRAHYITLIEDLETAISESKKQQNSYKKRVYDEVIAKIKNAKNVVLHVDKEDLNQTPESNENKPNKKTSDKTLFQTVSDKNEKLRREIILLRCFRILTTIGVKRNSAKVLKETIENKKNENSQLYNDKFVSELHEATCKEDLKEKHRYLSNTKANIEILKQQLDNEKMSNIQLVHWKAKNMKTIDQLKNEIDSFGETINDYNIDDLVKKLDDAQTELDNLRETTNLIDTTTDIDVRIPMQKVEKIRTKVRATKLDQARLMKTFNNDLAFQEKLEMKELFVQQLSDENIELRHENESLLLRVEELERQKQNKSVGVRALMEGTLRARASNPLKMQARTTGRIVKPYVPNVSRSFSRI
ncbi:hypothetical protein TRFO_15776 [Tritrichomonas foetus]|uniref:Uncharacterized protein n=1 Tax=Tritrichomonas foetus TaxID=1144522 RepID=A0A1J4KVX2_9EUKA|nr:hypothetical protein TRFO_15776 [Tritrichomonas foetus]|eukprot:OHT13900.1 hypothetical protein TRFO_15776 [Tritrichomonas foetus]